MHLIGSSWDDAVEAEAREIRNRRERAWEAWHLAVEEGFDPGPEPEPLDEDDILEEAVERASGSTTFEEQMVRC
jgi:hypothetical protein